MTFKPMTIAQYNTLVTDRSFYKFALNQTRHPSDADDVFQQAAFNLWSKRTTVDGSGNLRSLFYRVIRNCWVDELRKRKVREAPSIDDEAYADLRDLPLAPSNPDVTIELRQTFNHLEKAYPRGVYILARHLQGDTEREIADTLDTAISNVHRQIVFARNVLERRLGANHH
jgi:RNA polymerase sigma-70 factor, ECF subfamily